VPDLILQSRLVLWIVRRSIGEAGSAGPFIAAPAGRVWPLKLMGKQSAA
jgi:hypothetical protein